MEKVKRWWRAVFRREEERDDASPDAPKTLSIFFSFFFILNYTIGTGYLGIPFVFYHSGIITGVLTQLVITLICYFGAIWMIESMARAQVNYWCMCSKTVGIFECVESSLVSQTLISAQ